MRRWAVDSIKQFRTRNSAGKRVLINEILTQQLLITALIGALAIAGLYWGGQWVLQDNYNRWAMQWTDELNELGAPLYLPDDNEAILRLESFIDKYPEIDRVTYYMKDGSELFHLRNDGNVAENAGVRREDSINQRDLERLTTLVSADTPYLIRTKFYNARAFHILAPVWTESITGDGLFNIDLTSDGANTRTTLIGFVGLELDFSLFHNDLLANMKIAALVLLLLLFASGLVARRYLARSLTAISDLQQPIAELAKGNLAVQFKPAEHREISEIVEALESTASALGERDARLSKLANHDGLTGLFNRHRMVEELEQEIASVILNNGSSALFFIDLDQFKYVNDTCGHPAGDRLIKKVADQLIRTVDAAGVVARFGGDEFAVLVRNVTKREASALSELVLEDMRRLAHVESQHVFHVNCSIGVTMIDSDKFDHDELIAQADIACREAKESGRNRSRFYNMTEGEAQKIVADVGWISKIRDAIDSSAFKLRFQPIVEIASGRITHHEVLLRLVGEDGKIISPDAFLPAAARFGLMSEIDTWLVGHAIETLAEYRKDDPELRFSINLSANAFETENLAEFVKASLDKHSVPAVAVIFEITESLAVRRLDYVEKQVNAIRKLGCELALDDFGTGYSSFGYLQRLDVDYIKIDGIFIRDLVNNPVDQKMVRLIGEVGREAGMRTIAEYVQNAPTLALLADLGIDLAQGFFIGKPTVVPTTKSMPIPINLSGRIDSRKIVAGKNADRARK